MRCLAGIQSWDGAGSPSTGSTPSAIPDVVRRSVGYMPERVSFPAEMRTAAYLGLRGGGQGHRPPDRAAAVELALTRAGLDGVRSRIIGNLSKGYRQRVGLAQALLGDPALVILDEPTAGLDPLNLLDIRAVLSDYAADHVVVLSTHTLPEARLLCDRLLVLAQGSIVYDGPTVEMTLAGAEARRVRVRAQGGDEQGLGAAGRRGRRPGRPGRLPPGGLRRRRRTRRRRGGGRPDPALVLAGWAVEAIEPLSDVLEDAFRQAVLADPDDGGRRP